MTSQGLLEKLRLLASDLRTNRGRRLRHGVRWRSRRLKQRVVAGRPLRNRPVIYAVPFGPEGRELLRRLAESELAVMWGGSQVESSRMIHVAAEDIGRFCRLLRSGAADGDLFVRLRDQPPRELTARAAQKLETAGQSFDLLVVERTIDVSPQHVQCSRIAVAVWASQRGPYDSIHRETGRSIPIVGRLRPRTFDELLHEGHDFDAEFPTPDAPTFPIDVVYTWVDGEDEAWRKNKDRFSGRSTGSPAGATHDERFRSRDELRYSLRSLELFAPWVRHVFIVTADQTPDWLNVDNSKITLVSHRDIYREQSWLPTFNSSSIETQLHHIPDLATRFLYFNDDFFLGQSCEPGDFFLGNGVLKFFPSDQRAYERDIDESSPEYIQADKNAIELLKEIFPAVGRSIMCHAPYPSDRDLLLELEDTWPDHFAACAAARFRSCHDLRPIAFMQYHYGFQTRRAVPSTISHRYLALWKDMVVEQMANVAKRRSYKTFCINDVGLQVERIPRINAAVIDFLDSYFPEPSSFER